MVSKNNLHLREMGKEHSKTVQNYTFCGLFRHKNLQLDRLLWLRCKYSHRTVRKQIKTDDNVPF